MGESPRPEDLLKTESRWRSIIWADAGADPQDYLEIAITYIPLLKPRLIIVALLQGDDIAQLIERGMRVPSIKDLASELFPKLVALAQSTGAMLANKATPLVTASWGADAAHIIAEKKLQLGDELRALALAGSVNPGLLQLAATDPNRMTDAYSARPQAVSARRQAVDILRAISALASAYGGHVMLLSMPSSCYFNSASLQMQRRMGFVLPDFLYWFPGTRRVHGRRLPRNWHRLPRLFRSLPRPR